MNSASDPIYLDHNATTPLLPEVVDAMLRGMMRRRFLIIPGFDSRLGVLAKRFVPGVVHWVMDRTVAAVARRHGAPR